MELSGAPINRPKARYCRLLKDNLSLANANGKVSKGEEMPQISVVMTAYNSAPYIEEAVTSICRQTYRDFELVVVDDGSEDDTSQRLQNLAEKDKRVRLVQNQKNLGVAPSINRIIPLLSGEYIARMDSDDIALPQRLARQIAYIGSNRVDVCGAWVRTAGLPRNYVMKFPETDRDIKTWMLFQNPFLQSTVLMKRQVLEQVPYRVEAGLVEDYDLWVRMAGIAKMGNVPEVLLLYRRHSGQLSVAHSRRQINDAVKVRYRALEAFGIKVSEEERRIHGQIRMPVLPDKKNDIEAMEAWLVELADRSQKRGLSAEIVATQWFYVALRGTVLGLWTAWRFKRSPLYERAAFSWWKTQALFCLCVLRIPYQSKLYNWLMAWMPTT